MNNKQFSIMEFLKCEQCGICCIIEPCQYGMWNDKETKCALLTEDNLCGLYGYLKDSELGFDKGCGNPLLRDVYLENKDRFLTKLENYSKIMYELIVPGGKIDA